MLNAFKLYRQLLQNINTRNFPPFWFQLPENNRIFFGASPCRIPQWRPFESFAGVIQKSILIKEASSEYQLGTKYLAQLSLLFLTAAKLMLNVILVIWILIKMKADVNLFRNCFGL